MSRIPVRLLAGFMLVMNMVPCTAAQSSTPDCATLEACIGELSALARRPSHDRHSLTGEESALIERVLSFDDAASALAPLLAHSNVNVADLASAALARVQHIDPTYLPRIVAGLDRGLGWLAPALGRMQTDEAASEAVDRFLVSESAPENQEAFAVVLSGTHAVPAILERARCTGGCDEGLHYLLGAVLRRMNEDSRRLAAPGLIAIARDPATSQSVASGALEMIAKLGDAGLIAEAPLLELRRRSPQLRNWIDTALIGIRSTASGEIFARRLRDAPDDIALGDVAETGRAAVDAGSAVVEVLDGSDDPEVRIAAARALGYIGYMPGVTSLIARLHDPVDPRMVGVAAEALGRLQAQEALPALDATAEQHWFVGARQAASEAARHIREHSAYVSRYPPDNFRLEFFSYQFSGEQLGDCKRPMLDLLEESAERKLRVRADPAASARIAELTKNSGGSRSGTEAVPHVALRVEDGWLMGSDQGEWGGELTFVGDDGDRQLVFSDNIENIVRLGDRLVAVTGLAHLISHGAVIELQRDGRRWSARTWRVLPDAPQASALVRPGNLFVKTDNGNLVLISPEGQMSAAQCAEE
jgi:HEAT repeat protein